MYWKNDDELISLIKTELYTSVIDDIMAQMGYLHQFLPPQIHPLGDDMIMAGRAMTVIEADIDSEAFQNGSQHLVNKPFGLMLEALDELKKMKYISVPALRPLMRYWEN